MEEWRDVKGYEGMYQVSNLGNVLSLHYGMKGKIEERPRKILKPVVNSTGYYVVSLKGKQHFVHRLVAEAFVPNPNGKPCIDHIDTNPKNNNINNLRWVTADENLKNPISHEKRIKAIRVKMKGKYGVKSNKYRAVYQYTLEGKLIKKWDCISDAARNLWGNTNYVSNITHCCKTKTGQAMGYIWRYEKEEVNPYISKEKIILQYSIGGEFIKEWNSIAEAAKFYQTSTGRICSCLKGLTNTCKGYKWKYK